MMIKTNSFHPLAAASAGLLLFASASNAALLALDDFSTYDEATPGGFGGTPVAGDLHGQDGDSGGGDPLGFNGTAWADVQSGNSQLTRRIRVSGGATDSNYGNLNGGTKFYRRAFDARNLLFHPRGEYP